VYGILSALATFGVIVAYIMVNVASLAKFTKDDVRRGKLHYMVAPVIGILLLAYTFYANVYPVPQPPISYFPYVLVVYLLLSTVYSVLLRKTLIPTSASEDLVTSEDLVASEDLVKGETL
jgi:amino acid transporter